MAVMQTTNMSTSFMDGEYNQVFKTVAKNVLVLVFSTDARSIFRAAIKWLQLE